MKVSRNSAVRYPEIVSEVWFSLQPSACSPVKAVILDSDFRVFGFSISHQSSAISLFLFRFIPEE